MTHLATLTDKPLRAISDEERKAYEADGVVLLRGVFDQSWIEFLRDAFAEAVAHPGPLAEDYTPSGNPGRFFGDLDMWQRLEKFRHFVFSSPAARIAAQVMGSDKINFFYDQMFIKEPGTNEKTPWHQDQPYWAVQGYQVCSIWLPLDPVKKESALRYVKGSHRWPAHNPHHFADDTPYEGRNLPELPDIDGNSDQFELLGWDVEPGDCLVFQGMMVHGSAGNASLEQSRRALATRWCGDDARYSKPVGEVAIPTSDPGLENGARMDCDLFPAISVEN